MNITINVTINIVPENTFQPEQPAAPKSNRGRRHLTETETKAKQLLLLESQLYKQRLAAKIAQLFGADIALQYQAGVL